MGVPAGVWGIKSYKHLSGRLMDGIMANTGEKVCVGGSPVCSSSVSSQ